jgi:phosphatidylinositol-3-phosphatase
VNHVLVVVLENQNYDDVVGNSAMPYLNGVIPRSALATQYFANIHPSIGDYFAMTTGQIITDDDASSGTVSVDNVVRELTSAGTSWRLYAQGLPSTGYLGKDVYPYVRHHVPVAYFSDVQDSPAQQQNLAPLTQLASDTSSGALPTFAMVIPDQQHNAHDCPPSMSHCSKDEQLAGVDQWLQENIDPLLSVPNAVVIVTFDEAGNDDANGGGHIATVFMGAGVKPGFRSTTFYQHQSLYRFILEKSGITALPPEAASAPSMDEFLQ